MASFRVAPIAALLSLFVVVNAAKAGAEVTRVHTPLVLQTNLQNCGLAALSMLLSSQGVSPVSLRDLEATAALLLADRWLASETKGYSVGELQRIAQVYGIDVTAARITLSQLKRLQFPLVAWIDLGSNGHFTLVEQWRDSEISLADPTRGYLSVSEETWRRLWLKGATGVVLLAKNKIL